MTLSETLNLAFAPFKTRTLESLLIALGVALGVAVVVSMLALILTGLEQQQRFSTSLSARELSVFVTSSNSRGFLASGSLQSLVRIGRTSDRTVSLQRQDLKALQRKADAVEFAYLRDYAVIQEAGMGTGATSSSANLEVRAVTESFATAAKLELLAGSWFTRDDFARANRVVVVSDYFAAQRFPGMSAVGKELKSAQRAPYKIIGVFAAPKGDLEFASQQSGNAIGARGLVPWGIPDLIHPAVHELRFLAKPGQTSFALDQLQRATSQRWGGLVSVTSRADQFRASLSTAINSALVTAGFACAGLIIAAINITNLMLARVIGRTRQIGIARALGASRTMVFKSFLEESLALGFVGGLFGLLCAWGLTLALNAVLQSPNQVLNLTLRPVHFAFGLLIGLGISLLFGLYPAVAAARIRPTEALRA